MIFQLRIENMKDATGEVKRAMIMKLKTEVPGLDNIQAVAELAEGTPLAIEIDGIIADMLEQKKTSIKASNQKVEAKALKRMKKVGTK